MPFYTSPEQLMRERSELARKGIARGRSVVVLTCADGVLFVAENHSSSLHKVSEIYDRIGFAAVGRYNEYENLRVGGIRHADLRGYSNDRRDVTGRSLAHAYAQTLGTIFTDQLKPYEVEICVAEVGAASADDVLYRVTYDGSIVDEPEFVVMGGSTEPISNAMKSSYRSDLSIADGIAAAVKALRSAPAPGTPTNAAANAEASVRELGVKQLEVAILDRRRPRRAFRRLVGAALAALLPGGDATGAKDAADAEPRSTSALGTTAATSEEAPANPPAGDASGDATREAGTV